MQDTSPILTKKQKRNMTQRDSIRQSRLRQQIFKTLYLLRIVITNTRLYSIDHPKTKEMIGKAFESLNKTLRSTRELTLLIIDNDIIINNKAIRAEESDYFALFITVLKQKDISHISFKKGLKLEELTSFLSDLSSTASKTVHKIPGITFGKLQLKEDPRDNLATNDPLSSLSYQKQPGDRKQEIIVKLNSLSSRQLLLAQELFFSIRKEQSCDLRGIQESMSSFVTLFSQNLNPLSLLANLKSTDEYTFTHVINVCILTLAQAEALGFTGQHLYEIGMTATLYDIGKTFIPEEILNKPGTLDPHEQQLVKGHAMKGAGYLLSLDDTPKLAVLAALEHHIHFDGSGYPDIGSSWNTNIVSQMISIADTYDAMRCSRPYRRATSEKIIRGMLLKKKGAMFNPFLVDNFISILSRK